MRRGAPLTSAIRRWGGDGHTYASLAPFLHSVRVRVCSQHTKWGENSYYILHITCCLLHVMYYIVWIIYCIIYLALVSGHPWTSMDIHEEACERGAVLQSCVSAKFCNKPKTLNPKPQPTNLDVEEMCIHVCRKGRVSLRIGTHGCIRAYKHPNIQTSKHTYIHTHIHTYIHTYIHTSHIHSWLWCIQVSLCSDIHLHACVVRMCISVWKKGTIKYFCT